MLGPTEWPLKGPKSPRRELLSKLRKLRDPELILSSNAPETEDQDDWCGRKEDWDIWLVDVSCVDTYVHRQAIKMNCFNILKETINSIEYFDYINISEMYFVIAFKISISCK